MYAIYRLRQAGIDCLTLEAGDGVGGTWYWNRYPGARCDVESLSYSYSFSDELQQEWRWSKRYSTQPEILKYANHVADRFDLRRDIVFNARVAAASYDTIEKKWTVTTEMGEVYRATYVVMATGCLSVPMIPNIPGLNDFTGDTYHTANWPADGVDFSDTRVGIIGTGSSAIQSIPLIAQQAKHLTVFQRTANFSIPAWDQPITPEQEAETKRRYPELRDKARNNFTGDFIEEAVGNLLDFTPEQQTAELERHWQLGGFNILYAFPDIIESEAANELAAEFVREKIRARVNDPEVAELLCPKSHPFGSKRLCVDTGYYETYNRDNVTLVDIASDPIRSITPRGLDTQNRNYEFDALVLATGFDAMTGALTKIDITGSSGRLLREIWSEGARTYLGIAIAGFPNLFLVNGPGSPSVLTNMVSACEQHVEWISDLIEFAETRELTEIEAEDDAQNQWAEQVTADANQTLYAQANSWYLGANIPGKPRIFLPYVAGFKPYIDQCDAVVKSGYRGFQLRR